MSWLAPLGFLSLIGIVFLIVIYIIKPNYQQKYISSTYIWRQSLKYKKKHIPVSKLNNVLLFLCQLLILTLCALLLAQPVIRTELMDNENEKVIILDASAGMRVSDGNDTRFERAVAGAKALAQKTFEEDGVVSVIYADSTPETLMTRTTAEQAQVLYDKLDALVQNGPQCSYGSANMTEAVALAEEVLRLNDKAQVYLYTGTEYIEKNGVIVENVAKEGEWNVAVLDATAEKNTDGHYEISVNVGCYGKTEMVTVYCRVHGPNGKTDSLEPVEKMEFFDPSEEEKTVVFTSDDFDGEPLTRFESLELYVSVADSLADDNSFFLYGGTKPTINIQYASSQPNNFFNGVIRTIQQNMRDKWEIVFTPVRANETPATSGYDFYIFEHDMPEEMPTDGFVLLVDPQEDISEIGIHIGAPVSVGDQNHNDLDSGAELAAGTPHDVTKFIDFSGVKITKYMEVVSTDGTYETLAFYKGKDMILLKDEPAAKLMVWAFDLHYSNFIGTPYFSFLMLNTFNHFIPSTFSSNAFEIGDTVKLTARGTELKISGNGEERSFETSVGEYNVTKPGTYTVTQKPMQGDSYIIESFFVQIPTYESNITKQVDSLPLLNVEDTFELGYEDLLFYFAIALVTLMFAEWWLQSKKNF